MARKNKYKINGQIVNDDSEFASDESFFIDEESSLEAEFHEDEDDDAIIAVGPYPENFEYEDDDYYDNEDDVGSEVRSVKKKRKKKTRKEKFRYRGKYELLPERENWKQIKFYRRRFLSIGAALITGLFAILLGLVAYKYNALFSVLTILIAVPGLIYSMIGLVRVRTKGVIVVIVGLVFNIIGLIMIISPLKTIYHNFAAIKDALKDLLESFK